MDVYKYDIHKRERENAQTSLAHTTNIFPITENSKPLKSSYSSGQMQLNLTQDDQKDKKSPPRYFHFNDQDILNKLGEARRSPSKDPQKNLALSSLMSSFSREQVRAFEGLVNKINFKCTSTSYRQDLYQSMP